MKCSDKGSRCRYPVHRKKIFQYLLYFVANFLKADANAMFGEMAAYHPRNPHWYLPTIGIEPYLHRKGLGSALLTQALSRCDQEHMPATWNPATPPIRRYTSGSDSRGWASYVRALRRP